MYSIVTNIVPTPTNITVTAPNTQIVGQSLTLECSVTTVRGITSRVDIVWNSDGVELNRTGTPNITRTTDDKIEYIDIYTITLLKDTDINRTFQCEMIVHSIPSIMVNGDITLNVSGKQVLGYALVSSCSYLIIMQLISYCICYSFSAYSYCNFGSD